MTIAFSGDEMEELNDPASLPQRDGKPVLPGDEIENCGTCSYCKLRFDDVQEPFSACTFKGDPRYRKHIAEIFPVDPNQMNCAAWCSGQSYDDQLRVWRWRRRCANDFDCQREEQEYRRLEQQDLVEGRKEERQRGLPGPRKPKFIGG